jgi:polyisoprenoid-binding protein YceI
MRLLLFLAVALCAAAGCTQEPRPAHKAQPVIAQAASSTDSTAVAAVNPSAPYTLAPESRFDVKTEKAGMLGGFAHNHLIRARSFSGQMVYDAQHPETAEFTVTVAAEGLEVLTAAKDSDKSKIRQTMLAKVLKAQKFPNITFVSRHAAPAANGVRIDGDLTLLDQTRPVSVDVTLKAGDGKLTALGTFTIRQSDFGIKPYSAALGSIKVADRVTFDFEAVGTR